MLTSQNPEAGLTLVDLPSQGVSACLALRRPIDSMVDHERGTPVVFGGSGVIRFFADEAIQAAEFSKGFRSSADLNLSFTELELESAIILVARAARIDVAIPHGLTGKVSGRLRNVDWQQALITILEIADKDLEPVRSPNGLVRFQ